MKRLFVGVVSACMLVSCSGSEDRGDPPSEPTTVTTNPYPTPPYQLRQDRNGWVTAYVIDQFSDDELSRVFYDVLGRLKQQGVEGGWRVSINCGSYEGPRLGNGKFAVDQLGAAQVGFTRPDAEFETLPNRAECP